MSPRGSLPLSPRMRRFQHRHLRRLLRLRLRLRQQTLLIRVGTLVVKLLMIIDLVVRERRAPFSSLFSASSFHSISLFFPFSSRPHYQFIVYFSVLSVLGEFQEEISAARLANHLSLLSCVFSPCGRFVLSGSNHGKLTIWRIANELVADFHTPTKKEETEPENGDDHQMLLLSDFSDLLGQEPSTEKKVSLLL